MIFVSTSSKADASCIILGMFLNFNQDIITVIREYYTLKVSKLFSKRSKLCIFLVYQSPDGRKFGGILKAPQSISPVSLAEVKKSSRFLNRVHWDITVQKSPRRRLRKRKVPLLNSSCCEIITNIGASWNAITAVPWKITPLCAFRFTLCICVLYNCCFLFHLSFDYL